MPDDLALARPMHGPAGGARVLQVHPTRRCNLACGHCYSWSGPRAREELSLELLLACVEDAAGLGYTELAVSGGEPLLYRGLAPLLARARSVGMTTTMTTNGMLASYHRWDPVAPLVDALAVSIDGRPAEHDRIRGRRGAFDRTVENLEVLRDSGVAFGFVFTLTRHNVESLEFVVRLAAEQGARSVRVHPLTLHGRAIVRMPGSRPDSHELVAALRESARLAGELDVALHVDALARGQFLAYRERLVPARPVRELADAAPILVVEPDSTVVPLTHEVSRDLALGRLVEAPLPALAPEWIASGRGERLAQACEDAWSALAAAEDCAATYWYDEVAERTRADAARAAKSIPIVEAGVVPARKPTAFHDFLETAFVGPT
ncbi:MAG TPA: radical SAM protein [Usitatibacter sp.]|nr:radical SAM protein [Usitatibacter sp.]